MPSRRYGWVRDLPDIRDHTYKADTPKKDLPLFIDLRGYLPEVYDQGSLGSCTANALAAAHQFVERKINTHDLDPSRLFIYYNARELEHTVHSDSGCQIRSGIKVLATKGVCEEKDWPYVQDNFTVRPISAAYTDAAVHKSVGYSSVSLLSGVEGIQQALADGFPVTFGFTVYSSFESTRVASSGFVPMPAPTERPLGGHAVLCVGYDAALRCLLIRNSWGAYWGQEGYCWMPYDYIEKGIAADAWVIRNVL